MTLLININISFLPAYLSSQSTTNALSFISISVRRPLALIAVQDSGVWCVCNVSIDRHQPINSQHFFFSFVVSWHPKKRLAETETLDSVERKRSGGSPPNAGRRLKAGKNVTAVEGCCKYSVYPTGAEDFQSGWLQWILNIKTNYIIQEEHFRKIDCFA